MRRGKTFIAVALTSSSVLVFLFSSLSKVSVPTSKAPTGETFDIPTPRNRVNVSATVIQVPQSVSTKHPVKPDIAIISENFRKSVPQSSAYWNRMQNFNLRQLDSGNFKGNSEKDEQLLWSQCHAQTVEMLNTNIQDFNSYPPLYQDFLQGMECRTPPILIDQPQKCGGNEQTFLLFGIKSVPNNFQERQTVRETWGQEKLYEGGLQVRLVFLLGAWSLNEPHLDILLKHEADQFGDVLQWDFRDSFFNLTLKENVFFNWVLKHCSQARFIFKGDDDVFVNTMLMVHFLQSLEPEKASKLYTGHVVTQASPFRDAKNKYYVPMSFFEGAYPVYTGGGGFLFSGSLVRDLYRVSQYIPFFPIDDVYTGMCFQALGIQPESHKDFRTFDIREEDRDNACVHKDLVLVHKRTPQQIMLLWKRINSPLLTC
ncbi:hypothetical protein Z043_122367 [Scleropages formosus]|uniref:Hexosyltransferase n=1 Tax=Scleropages formosus TaxID=113540 RepID=A0A0P7UF94_SCLFO|nr:hypothetical protein Z043_122367 [Scleropages formosus]